jgi:hypothetical protein
MMKAARTSSTAVFLAAVLACCSAGSNGTDAAEDDFFCAPVAHMPGTFLHGSVHEDGEGVPGIQVELIGPNGTSHMVTTGHESVDFACFFQRVEPGHWILSAQRGQSSAQESVEAKEGQVTEIVLELR